MSSRWPDVLLTIIVVIGIMISLAIIALRDLSNTESLLLSLVLTILSLLGSWIASRYYSEISFNRSLRVFALKAAEKVNNLSNELGRLSAYLQHELESVENISPDEAILSKDARIEAAIHMINTLKSVNDTSLSDWQGVIGDELSAQKEAQQEEREEREENLRDLIDRVEQLSLRIDSTSDARDSTTSLLSKEVNSIKSDLRSLASQVGAVPFRRTKTTRQEVEFACPACSARLRYKQRTKEGSMKAVNCGECKAKLLSLYKNGSFLLTHNEPHPVRSSCPVCERELNGSLELLPGKTTTVDCPNCKANIQLVRSKNEVKARALPPKSPPSEMNLSEEIVTRVQLAMPPQPWPKGTSRQVAATLGLPHSLVSEAIDELVEKGIFDMQVDGKLYRQIADLSSSEK